MRVRVQLPLATLLLMLACATLPAWAHSMYQSAVLLDFHADSVSARLELPASRLEQVFGTPLREEALAQVEDRLAAYVAARVHVRGSDARAWNVRLTEPLQWQVVDGAPYIVAELALTPPAHAGLRQFTLQDDVITDALPTHVVLVSVTSDWNSSTFANDPELVGIVSGEQRSIDIDRTAGSWTRGFRSVFRLGTRHIAEGTDHLLFLLALLLPAPLLCAGKRWAGFAGVQHGFMQILKVVTAFTVGHSITLALAASGLVHVPAGPIEVLIAASILVSAIHAMRPLFPGKEPLIAAGFGLVHGLAFASTLAELGLHRWERVESILAFNLGIEAMQIVVVLCVMPSLMLLSRTRFYSGFRMTGAIVAALAAAGWIVERVWHRSLHVDDVVGVVAQHGLLFAVFLLALSLLASMLQSRKPLQLV